MCITLIFLTLVGIADFNAAWTTQIGGTVRGTKSPGTASAIITTHYLDTFAGTGTIITTSDDTRTVLYTGRGGYSTIFYRPKYGTFARFFWLFFWGEYSVATL